MWVEKVSPHNIRPPLFEKLRSWKKESLGRKAVSSGGAGIFIEKEMPQLPPAVD
jgi:hypothetical protein